MEIQLKTTTSRGRNKRTKTAGNMKKRKAGIELPVVIM